MGILKRGGFWKEREDETLVLFSPENKTDNANVIEIFPLTSGEMSIGAGAIF